MQLKEKNKNFTTTEAETQTQHHESVAMLEQPAVATHNLVIGSVRCSSGYLSKRHKI